VVWRGRRAGEGLFKSARAEISCGGPPPPEPG
jgi:hypothetical protein